MATNVAMLSTAKALNWTYGPDCRIDRDSEEEEQQLLKQTAFPTLDQYLHLPGREIRLHCSFIAPD